MIDAINGMKGPAPVRTRVGTKRRRSRDLVLSVDLMVGGESFGNTVERPELDLLVWRWWPIDDSVEVEWRAGV